MMQLRDENLLKAEHMYTIGTTVANRYLIEAVVGHGGMGTIYRAQDTRLGRIVALKVLRPDLAADRDACARFLREGQIAAQMIHPNVVRTYDAGEDQAGPFLVQELLSGQTLDRIIPLPPHHAASIMRDVASALSYIHGRGYIHCDIKPQNILLKQDGTPVLLDFGIARAEGAAATTLIATPHYLAPERAMGGPPTAAADLYAIGIVLYQTIEGHVPFDASSIPAIIQQHQGRPMPRLQAGGAVAPALDRMLAGLTAKNPAQRPGSAERVRDDLAAIARDAERAYLTMPIGSTVAAKAAPVAAARAASAQPHAFAHALQAPLSSLRATAATWAGVPAWRKRRWLAGLVGVLLALSLGFTLVRGERAQVRDGAPAGPTLLDAQPVRAESNDTQNAPPTPTETSASEQVVPVQPTDAPVQPTDVPAQPTDVPVQPTDVPVQPTDVPAQPANIQTPPEPPTNSFDNDDDNDDDEESEGRGRGENRPDKERDDDDDDDD